jgi:hypothetical protein
MTIAIVPHTTVPKSITPAPNFSKFGSHVVCPMKPRPKCEIERPAPLAT